MERVTIYWRIRDHYAIRGWQHELGVGMTCNVNGEQYLEIDGRQRAMLDAMERDGVISFRSKELEMRNGRLVPSCEAGMRNRQ